MVTKNNGKFYVYSKDGSKKLGGPYNTKAEANKRIQQIHYFKSRGR